MTIFATMTTSLTSKRSIDNNEFSSNNPFEEFIRSRGRGGRTGSLALPNNSLLDLYDKEQEQCNSLALIPPNTTTIRRHSSHCYPLTATSETGSEITFENKPFVQSSDFNTQFGENLRPPPSLAVGNDSGIFTLRPTPHQHNLEQIPQQKGSILGKESSNIFVNSSQLTQLPNIPPPVPKRTFKGKINPNKQKLINTSASSYNNSESFTSSLQSEQQQLFFQPKQHYQYQQQEQIQLLGQKSENPANRFTATIMSRSPINNSNLKQISNTAVGAECIVGDHGSDDDRFSLENSVFDEPRTELCTEIGINNSRQSIRSSSDSNKSQTASDTGYISNENEKTYQGDSIVYSSGGHNSRSRFSSVDTQSSLDSCLTEKTMDSPLSKDSFKMDLPTRYTSSINIENNNLNNSGNFNYYNSGTAIDNISKYSGGSHKNLPAVPVRKQYPSTASTASKIQPPSSSLSSPSTAPSSNTTSASSTSSSLSSSGATSGLAAIKGLSRPVPPTPPLRSQQSVDSINYFSSNSVNFTQQKQKQQSSSQDAEQNSMSFERKVLNNSRNHQQQQHQRQKQQYKQSQFRQEHHGKQGQDLEILNNDVTVSDEYDNENDVIPDDDETETKDIQEGFPISKSNSSQITTNSNGITCTSGGGITKSFVLRSKFARNNKPPPISYPKLHQRQDSSISSDSFSVTSSPGYNSKSMEAPLLQHASKINKSAVLRHQDSNDSFNMTSRFNSSNSNKPNYRQDSNISSDSFSQISSPGYNAKMMEAPLLLQAVKMNNAKQNFKNQREILKEPDENNPPTSPITKSASTPASLQTIVRFQNGSNMSLQHRIVNRRKSSNPYVTQGRLKFRLFQILLNAVALLAIAGGLAAYFKAYPVVKFINKTIITPPKPDETLVVGKNPAPGVCLPVIVKFCQNHNLPYNYTVFPNYIGHFGQPEAQLELEAYDALVDVRCYELVALFLCSLFVPKCGPTGNTVPPCKSLCVETMRRCGFFFDVFGLGLPEYLTCNLLSDYNNPDECVGLKEVHEARARARNPVCSGFLCDQKRCIPSDWQCDGHVDCLDQTDESQCEFCGKGSIYCGEKKCMSKKHICDGIVDCPYGQDERNCIRLSERNGDLGKGTLEIYKADVKLWAPACVTHWDSSTSPTSVCSMLGYSSVNSSKLTMRGSNITMNSSNTQNVVPYNKMRQKKYSNLLKEFSSCPINSNYPVVELTCTNFECGKVRNRKTSSKRIVGGSISTPGDWPFLAAILGGPEQIFYCAGVLIADQWVLTASHCIGNHTLRNINDWTIQLGVTRRHSHTYYGQKVKVRNVIPHPQYNSYIAHDNDIALFQLATKVAFHEHLLPVCLPPPGLKELRPGSLCTVIGWGKREDKNLNPNAATASYEPSVNEVEVPVLDRDICNEWLDTPNVTMGMICAGYQEGGKDACQGDSGGPLLCPYPGERDRWFVGGIVSWGIMCAHPKLPGVYANVPRYIPWITQQINRHSKPNYDNNSGY